MTNFEKYISSLTQDKFIDSMILNCDGCPVYPCCEDGTEDNGLDCEEKLRDWCEGDNRMKDIYPSYSVCGIPAKNKLLGRFLNHFYKLYTEEKIINGTRYIVEYHRSPFWAYEEPTLKLFIKDKLRTWHGQVWEVFPKGSRCGFGTTCFTALFPKKRMKKFLDTESKFVWNACNKS